MNPLDWDGRKSQDPESSPVHINYTDSRLSTQMVKPMYNKTNSNGSNTQPLNYTGRKHKNFRLYLSLITLFIIIGAISISFYSSYEDSQNVFFNGKAFHKDIDGCFTQISLASSFKFKPQDFSDLVESFYTNYDQYYNKIVAEGLDPALARDKAYEKYKSILKQIDDLYREQFPSYKWDDRIISISQGIPE